mmetsp:Transcript_7261/g.9036  ORF Transcript_7261/g.9036 Transcript_7261/m.9036 type:complete len:247 (+) Transcript_7261:215-955(+)
MVRSTFLFLGDGFGEDFFDCGGLVLVLVLVLVSSRLVSLVGVNFEFEFDPVSVLSKRRGLRRGDFSSFFSSASELRVLLGFGLELNLAVPKMDGLGALFLDGVPRLEGVSRFGDKLLGDRRTCAPLDLVFVDRTGERDRGDRAVPAGEDFVLGFEGVFDLVLAGDLVKNEKSVLVPGDAVRFALEPFVGVEDRPTRFFAEVGIFWCSVGICMFTCLFGFVVCIPVLLLNFLKHKFCVILVILVCFL